MAPGVIALLSWFDEDPAALRACVESLAPLPVRAVVAVDGRYRLFKDPATRSEPNQRAAILDAAHSIGAACVVHERPAPWTEVDKRAFLFRAAEVYAQPGDWYLVIDADMVTVEAPGDVMERLDATDTDVAMVGVLTESFANVAWMGGDGQLPTVAYGRRVKSHRAFFRAIPGLTVQGRHWDYVTPDGRNLWGDCDTREPGLLLHDVLIDHRDSARHPDRNLARKGYYKARDAAGIERKPATVAPSRA